MTEARRETYEQLIALGCTPVEAWADAYCHAEDFDGE